MGCGTVSKGGKFKTYNRIPTPQIELHTFKPGDCFFMGGSDPVTWMQDNDLGVLMRFMNKQDKVINLLTNQLEVLNGNENWKPYPPRFAVKSKR